jgi:hypothetical protein
MATKSKGEHCPWCSRDGIKRSPKGGLMPHLTFGGQRCVGTGVWCQADRTLDSKKALKPKKRS